MATLASEHIVLFMFAGTVDTSRPSGRQLPGTDRDAAGLDLCPIFPFLCA